MSAISTSTAGPTSVSGLQRALAASYGAEFAPGATVYQRPLRYGGLIGDPGEPLRHFLRDADGQVVVWSKVPFQADYSGGDKRFVQLAMRLNSGGLSS